MKAALLGVFGKGRSSSNGKSRQNQKMSEFPSDYTVGQSKTLPNNGDLSSMVENLNMKSSLLNKMNSTSCLTTSAFSSSTEKLTSTSAQVVKSSASASTTSASSSSVLSKKQVVHSLSSQELLKQQQQQNEMFQENRNFSRSVSLSSSSSSSNSSESRLKMMSSQRGFSVDCNLAEEMNGSGRETSPQEMRFQQKRVTQASKTKVMTDGFTAEKMAATNQELKRVHAGDVSYEEKSAMAAMKSKMEGEGFSAEKVAAVRQDQKQLKVGDTIEQQCSKAMGASMKVSTNDFTAEKVAMAKQEQRQTVTQGVIQQEKNMAATASSKVTITSKASASVSAASSSTSSLLSKQREIGALMSSSKEMLCLPTTQKPSIIEDVEEDLELLDGNLSSSEICKISTRLGNRMASCIEELKSAADDDATQILSAMNEMVRKAWAVPTCGYDLGSNLCHILRNNGGLDILIRNCTSENDSLKFGGAQLLEQCLSTENRAYVIENGLEEVVSLACNFTTIPNVAKARVGTGILEHLFKHSEAACTEVIRMGGLKSILYDCRSADVECLQHCAKALANLALYGGPENQQLMIKQKAPMWLFPLAFNPDDNIKYYACLAITSLVANKEIEAAVLRSGTLDLVEPFVTTHNPEDFATSSISHVHGQSKSWLMRLVPVLDSKREEARSLAAFHFAMEAGIKKKQGNTSIFHEIGAVEALRKVASSPNAIASKYAAQALQLIGEQVPHKLLQQVPLWTVEDVQEWVKQIGFPEYSQAFAASRVDGDLLLQLNEEMLREDIGITNGIRRKRFRRELIQLKRMADYSSCDATNLNHLLQSIGPEFSQYTYTMLQCGVDRENIRFLSEEQLSKECLVDNSIHRLRIAQAIRGMEQQMVTGEGETIDDKRLDVFISYRRSNGSQLASLLKVHLQLRSFSVFIDVERLEAGKFDNNLLHSIRQAKHFLLVLTPSALDRCIEDTECKDWVHREIVEALRCQCNIIPILDNFQWPDPESLPEDMRAVCYFNGIRWIHDYQDACVDKLERFMRGELNVRCDGPLGRYVGIGGGPGTPGTPGTIVSHVGHPYHRSASSDSAKGSTSSEKETNGLHGVEIVAIHQ